jgi:hypothetical protein
MRVLVDEVSMCTPRHMMWLHRQKVLHGIQLILIGDFNQCSIDPFMKTFDDHPLFGLLCDWNRVEMCINNY